MIYYDRIDVSKGISVYKTNKSEEFDICYYLYSLDIAFTFQPYACSRCRDLLVVLLFKH